VSDHDGDRDGDLGEGVDGVPGEGSPAGDRAGRHRRPGPTGADQSRSADDAVSLLDEPAVTVEIDEGEWQSILSRLGPAVSDDERTLAGNLVLLLGDGTRRWAVVDEHRIFVVHVADDPREACVVVSPRLIEAWRLVSGGSGVATLRIPHDAGGTASIEGEAGLVMVESRPVPDLPVDEMLAHQRSRARLVHVVDAESFVVASHVARRPPSPDVEDAPVPPMVWLGCEDGTISFDVYWPDLGLSTHAVWSEGPGSASVPLSPDSVAAVAAALEGGELTVAVPEDDGDAVWFEQDGFVAAVMALDPDGQVRREVEEQLAELFGGSVVHRDEDGDYRLSVDGVPVWARLEPTDGVTWLHVFAQVLSGVVDTTELLAELNQLNAATPVAKIVLVDDAVHVQGSLVAETLDPAEISTLYDRVRMVADDLGPALAVRFGGTPVVPVADRRWDQYAQTVVSAELQPGRWTPLNGPSAPEVFPFEGPVYVVTAWNPDGRSQPDGANHEANVRLAAAIAREHLGSCRALGSSRDGSHAEPSFLIWGATVDAAVALGAEFDQEAIFELTDRELVVVGVDSDRRSASPRR